MTGLSPFRDPAVPLAPEQLELRKRVLKQIEYDPESYDMGDWERIYWERSYSPCRTTRCIAGWAQYLARGEVNMRGTARRGIPDVTWDAIRLLGLTAAEFGTDDPDDRWFGPAAGLFYLDDEAALGRLRELAGGDGNAV